MCHADFDNVNNFNYIVYFISFHEDQVFISWRTKQILLVLALLWKKNVYFNAYIPYAVVKADTILGNKYKYDVI